MLHLPPNTLSARAGTGNDEEKNKKVNGSGGEQIHENKGGGQDSFKHDGRRGESLTFVHDDVPILVKLAYQRKDGGRVH
jgi:hypothetical protein